eukprot:CAMPEP_0118890738 /NCGR_PEP_ID=MMETSP1166-20130328/1063_1 /TAXON_ID=1104430 /ORGANISM="Chrysoreinhardia sp, Strain CCMP3193" /LENGTH=279 /DNA_ID=CAMNT_0006829359 /DNA_START=62 /DNA_END=901 /DNA_ORIENTATION=-
MEVSSLPGRGRGQGGALSNDPLSTILAYERKDSTASRRAHDAAADWEEDGHSCGLKQLCESERLEAAIAGACTILVAGASGCERRALAAIGVAGGLAAGLQKLSFERWYRRRYSRERARETWELDNYPKGEREEMTGLFTFKGMNQDDAKTVVQTMSEYKEFFVNLMMTEELQLREPIDRTPQRAAAVGAAFALAALIPLVFSDTASKLGLLLDDQGLVVHRCAGLAVLALLGARRAAMCVLPLATHVTECLVLGLAAIATPKLILAALDAAGGGGGGP